MWFRITTRQIKKRNNRYISFHWKLSSLNCKNLPELSLPREAERREFVRKSFWWDLIYKSLLFNYEFFCCDFWECLFLPALPRWLSHHSAFIRSSALINGCSVAEDFVPKPHNLKACGVAFTGYFSWTRTGASSAPVRVTSCRLKMLIISAISSFHSTAHLTVWRAPCCISFTLSTATFSI